MGKLVGRWTTPLLLLVAALAAGVMASQGCKGGGDDGMVSDANVADARGNLSDAGPTDARETISDAPPLDGANTVTEISFTLDFDGVAGTTNCGATPGGEGIDDLTIDLVDDLQSQCLTVAVTGTDAAGAFAIATCNATTAGRCVEQTTTLHIDASSFSVGQKLLLFSDAKRGTATCAQITHSFTIAADNAQGVLNGSTTGGCP